jgi:RHS repeat-associated protein
VVSYRYDPWGNLIASGGSNPALANPFRFTGREWDAESDLYFYRARYYDPEIGRFLSPDPLDTHMTPNRYAYVGNNPASQSDPLGLGPDGRPDDKTKAKVGGGGLMVLGGIVVYTSAAANPISWIGIGLGAGVTIVGYCIFKRGTPPTVPRFVKQIGKTLSAPLEAKRAEARAVIDKFNQAGGKDQFSKKELEDLGVVMQTMTPEERKQVLEAEGIPYQKYADALKEYNMLPDDMK